MGCRTLFVCCCLLAYVLTANSEVPAERTIQRGPQNEAIEVGPSVVLDCQASGPGEVVQWTEYITNPNGAIISSNEQILTHPNSDRYSILHDGATVEYNLQISPTVLTDGGTYRCQDTSDGSLPVYAQLVLLGGPPTCTSNIPPDGTVVEGLYYTIECTVSYRGNMAPTMTWDGPEEWRGFWNQAVVTSNTTVLGGVNMNVTRFFDEEVFTVLANFTAPAIIPPNSATNVPTWSYTIPFQPLHVVWKPGNMYTIPLIEGPFQIGDVIQCFSDGYPTPNYFWQNGATNERIDGQDLVLRADNVGTTTFRCNAINGYGSNDLFVQITVSAPTTPTSPTTTQTTTTPPAEGSCNDLTGRWSATTPSSVDLCIEVNATNGQVIGLFRNATDPYFIEIRGSVQPNKYDEVGFAGVWPVNIGTQAFVGVCSNCFGTEHLQIRAVGRRIGDFRDCTDFGQLLQTTFYEFTRTGPPCRGLFSEYGIKL